MPNIRVHVMGSHVDIRSPVPANEFLQGMVNLVNQRSADTSWTGYHQFETVNDEIVFIRVRAIDIVETIPELVEVKKPTKPKAKRKTTAKPKTKAKAKVESTPVVEEKDADDIYK